MPRDFQPDPAARTADAHETGWMMVEKTRKPLARGQHSTVAIVKSPVSLTPSPGTDVSGDRDPLDLIAEEFAELCRKGKTPSVSDFVVKYPQHAEDLNDLLPAVGQMEALKRIRRSTSPGSGMLIEAMPAHIGDYKILREIGRGGMGVVYEAEQASLGRRVALKILPLPARTEQEKRDRFLREAQAAARLHHTNIVPVFGVGEDNGIPYYVMQMIRGCGLDDVIHGWNDPKTDSDEILRKKDWRTIARMMSHAAEALDYAHGEGVLHRDIKPGNLLLDASGHLWVTDFGLAKLLGENTLTGTGHVLGTLQYMAPEALTGQSDARTDVYGLGMVLYELLTGKMPFTETNPAVLVKQIGVKEPPAPHTHVPRIPRDLETICLKAIAREASRRYATAGELADDLRAFLAGRPIAARRLSAVGKTWLWAKRNPAVASSLAATALIVIGSAVFGWTMYGKTKTALANESQMRKNEKAFLDERTQQLAREHQLRETADAANTKYNESLQLSLMYFGKLLDEIAAAEMIGPGPGIGPGGREPHEHGPGGRERGPLPGRDGPPDGLPEGQPFQPKGGQRGGRLEGGKGPNEALISGNAKLLEQIVNFFEEFAKKNQTIPDPKLKLRTAQAYRKLGMYKNMLRDHEQGNAFTKKAVALLDELVDDPDTGDEARRELMLIRRAGERLQRP